MASSNPDEAPVAHAATLPTPQSSAAADLPALIDRAAAALANARSSAEVLEAKELAGVAYDMAKLTGRLLRAKQAHDELVSAAYRAQGDALLIESQAKMRLADEYDAAQAAGEVASQTDGDRPSGVEDLKPTAAQAGLTHKQVHEARQIRNAERADPGVVRRVIDERVSTGQEPTKAAIREAVRPAPRPRTEPTWTPADIIPVPKKAQPFITGDAGVFDGVEDARRAIEPLGPAREAMRRFSPQLRHAVTSEGLLTLSRWFADAADELRQLEEASRVAAE